MKLKKIDSNWCRVNFKYENIPTFCFICGLIGHSDKFCEKLFDTPAEKIVKPYGPFMKAEQRRRNHTIGSKWLRMGGGTRTAAEEEEDKVVTEIVAIGIRQGDISATEMEIKSGDDKQAGGDNLGVLTVSPNIIALQHENKDTNVGNNINDDSAEIIVSDLKRRRMGQESIDPDT